MSWQLSLGTWEQQRVAAQAIRLEVFVAEQGVPVELEWDAMDALSLHALVHTVTGEPIATGRLLPDGHIGRMAVRRVWRRQGVGALVLQSLMQAARARGDAMVMLHAQLQAEAFYQRFGFAAEGEVFEEAGIAHRLMRHVFSVSGGS